MTEIHAEAPTCPACGAIRGGWGRSVESWRKASAFMLGVAAFFVLAGIAFGTWVASDPSTIWFDGMIAFLFVSPFMLFAGGVGLFRRYVIPPDAAAPTRAAKRKPTCAPQPVQAVPV
ncbi:zinc ribbon domain-containing protein [Paracoccus kondratievae]